MVRSTKQHTGFCVCQPPNPENLARSLKLQTGGVQRFGFRVMIRFADKPRTSMSPSSTDPFEVLGLPPRFRLDAQELRRAWMRRVSQVHPDAAGSVGDGTYANDSFRVLADPITRAQALLLRLGAPGGDERAMPGGFLMEMMELRERADAASGDAIALASLRSHARETRSEAIERIALHFESVGEPPMTASVAQAIRVELNVVRAFDRMLEQLDREAEGS